MNILSGNYVSKPTELVEGGVGLYRRKCLVVVGITYQKYAEHAFKFDYWANSLVHLLQPKSSMASPAIL